ncbi:MAG: chorismate synthase [Slackia piriformis]|uniref:Chorismate synthase n=1 Tax=Slackia piriformis TaxID=626934 RepID=A0A943UXZ2_9ACTN|nr:chorismate synthase [Slackia piriformis]
MASRIGEHFSVSIFGQSHSTAIGCAIEGIPAGKRIDEGELQAFLARRAPGGLPWSTPRKEGDAVEILCGLLDGVSCGAPLAALIRNTNTRSSDYEALRRTPRPGHADYVADVKFGGAQDVAGGGHFSGRLTAPLCIAGGIAKQLLAEEGVVVGAHLSRVAGIDDASWPLHGLSAADALAPGRKAFPVVDDAAGAAMRQAIGEARDRGDSVGGVVECAVVGLPVGIGEPMFDGLENAIARIVFGIPAVKGVEFGRGFAAADMHGSSHNDPYRVREGRVVFASNNAGGILGGISTGEPVVVRAAFKPTSSIFIEQDSVDLKEMSDARLALKGRHDPCVAVRAVPVMEAVCAIAVYDAMLEARMDR